MPEHRTRRSATIYDVARVAGVSHQTVARYLNGSGIRSYNRVKVKAALDELKYRPNLTARSLATNRTHRLGALGFEIAGHNPGRVLQGASDAARELGFVVEFMGIDPLDASMLSAAVEALVRQGAEGLLITSPTNGIAEALNHLAIDVPVEIEGGEDAADRQRLGARLALEHLTALGHVRIAHLAGPQEWIAARLRREEYEAWAVRTGVPSLVQVGDWNFHSGHRNVEVLLEYGITAVFAANDRVAMGALLRLHELGIRVPDQISVVGFDDLSMSAYTYPPLTTVRQDFTLLGRVSAQRLIAKIEDQEHESTYPDPVLIARSSSGPRTA